MRSEKPTGQPDMSNISGGVAELALPALTEAYWKHLASLPGLLLWTAPTSSQGEGLPSWYVYTGQDQGAPDGHEWLEAIHPEDRPQVESVWASVQTSPGPFVSTFRLRRADGIYQAMTLSVTPLIDVQGAILEWVGWGTMNPALPFRQSTVSGAPVHGQQGNSAGAVDGLPDVIERQNAIQRSQQALEAVLEMAEALVAGPVVADVSQVTLPREPGPAARQLAELTCRVLGCARVGISRLDVETDLLLPLAVAGLSPEQEKQWWLEQQQQQVPLHASPEPRMVAQLEAGEVLQFDLTQPPYRDQPNPYGITTMLLVPLRVEERLLGLLSLDHAGLAHIYTPDEQRLALAVARLAALVIERERLLHERAEAESRALALQEANQRLETFLSIVSHELRTPVTSLKANLQIILRRVRQGKDAAEAAARFSEQLDLLERMEHQMRRLTRLLDDVIDLARIRTGKLELAGEPCNLSKVVADVVQTEQAAYPGRTIQLKPLPSEAVPVLIDSDRIEQVITNYLTNALKYSLAHQPVKIGLTLEQDQARVWVRDQGPGIPSEEQDLIWALFHRVPGIEVQSGSGVGLGLGLHISKSLIERHGGQVGVESTPGSGSTFWFTLPLAEASRRQT